MVIMISGKSGVGKTFLEKCFTKKYDISQFTIYTTRSKRKDDSNNYVFLSIEEFNNKLNNNEILLLAKSKNNVYYGINKEELKDKNKCRVISFIRNDDLLKFKQLLVNLSIPYYIIHIDFNEKHRLRILKNRYTKKQLIERLNEEKNDISIDKIKPNLILFNYNFNKDFQYVINKIIYVCNIVKTI